MPKNKAHTTPARGAVRRADIAPDWLAQLNAGQVASRTLVEILALDQAALAQSVFALDAQTVQSIKNLQKQGIMARMQGVAGTLLEALGADAIATSAVHASDTVRGWACFMLARQSQHDGWSLQQLLTKLEPLAADAHFGVREWAWMAARPALVRDVDAGIAALLPWAKSADAYLRRFASEALRPRGVWCAHISELKTMPQRALPLLELLKADDSEYVRLSVGNWLNDAAKTSPDWVRALCMRWQQENPCAQTAHICRRAVRNIV